MSVSSDITDAEAYDGKEEIYDISLKFVANGQNPIANGQLEFALYQNEPNPFVDYTVIGFDLPEEMSGVIRIYDGSGKVVKVIEGDYKTGYNQIQLSRKDLQIGGIYYYHLSAGKFTASKKFILTK